MEVHWQIEAAKKKIIALENQTAIPQDYRANIIEIIRNVIPFDAACCTSVDPITHLSTGAATENGIEKIHHLLFENEYLHDDFNKYANLAKAADSTATLSGTTSGQLIQSARYRNILGPSGFRDELRAALVFDRLCWGYLTLFRNRTLFKEAERSFVSSLVPSISRVMRKKSLELTNGESARLEMVPGIMILSDRLAPISSDTFADRWLSMLRQWERIDDSMLPRPVRAVCSHAKSKRTTNALSKVCLRTPDGQFLVIRASRLREGSGSIQLAVCFETATLSDVIPLMMEAYGLSLREKQIFEQLIRGFSTKELAASLHISTYTVQDHLKSIFQKTGVSSRRELVGKLFLKS